MLLNLTLLILSRMSVRLSQLLRRVSYQAGPIVRHMSTISTSFPVPVLPSRYIDRTMAEQSWAAIGDTISTCMYPLLLESVKSNDALVVTRFGKLESVKNEGLQFVPLFTKKYPVFMGVRSFATSETIVPELNGKPVSIKCLINFRVTEPEVYVFLLKKEETFVHLQAERVMKTIVSKYSYDDLKSNPEVPEAMRQEINRIVRPYGVTVENFNINDVQYDKSVASSLLVEQQAHSIGNAKTVLVNTCTGIVISTIKELEAQGISFTDHEKARFASSLMISLTSGNGVSPVISLS